MDSKGLKRLNKRHYDAIELLMQGMNAQTVAEKLKVSVASVYMWNTSPVFMEQKERHREEVAKRSMSRLAGNADLAASKITELMNCGSSHVELKAAVEVLNRIFGTPTQKQEITADVKTESKIDLSMVQDEETKALLKELHKKMGKKV